MMKTPNLFSIFIFLLTACTLFAPGTLIAEEPARESIVAELQNKSEGHRVQALRDTLKLQPDATWVPLVTPMLKDSSADVRRAAAVALEKLGTLARGSVPALIAAAKDKDTGTRSAILSALGALGPPGQDAVPILIEALQDSSPQLRIVAVDALRRHGPAAGGAMPALIALALNEKHPDAINALVASLAESNPVPPELAPFFANSLRGSGATRTKAMEALNKIGAKAVPAVLPQLKSDTVSVRREAAAFLEKFAKDARDAAPQLAGAMKDSDAYVRKSAAAALCTLGCNALPILPELIALLADNDASLRPAAAGVIESMGAPAQAAVPALLQLLQDKTLASRTAAGKALAKLGAPGVAALVTALKSPRDEVRAAASLALPHCGEAAMPVLAEALKSDCSEIVLPVIAALDRMGGARGPAIPELIALLRHKTPGMRSTAAQSLNRCGAHAVKPLTDALVAHPDAPADVRSAITDALGRAGAAAVPPLMEIVKARPDGPLLYAAVEALGKAGPSACDAVPMLTDLLTTVAAPPPPPAAKRSSNQIPVVPPYVKLDATALQALGAIGPRAVSALPMMFELLKDGDSTVRSEAARAIGRIASGKERVPPLNEIIERCDPGTVANALRAFQDAGMDALLLEFDTPSAVIRLRVASAFANLPLANACPYLSSALKNEDAHLRAGAALALSEIRRQYKGRALNANAAPSNSDQVLAALKGAAKDPDPDVRVLAAYAFMKAIDADNAELIEQIATGVANCSADYRLRAMMALDYYNLEKTGRKSAAALPVLIRAAAQDTSGPPNPRALIQRIGLTKEDVPVLVDALKEKNAITRKMVCRLIEGLGPNAKDAVPALIDTLGDDERIKVKGLEAALIAIGPDAVPHLLLALKDPIAKRRAGAAQALNQMNLAGECLAQVAGLLGDDRAEVRASALIVLSASGERAKYALPRVRELLLDEDKFVTRYSQDLFTLLGTAGTPALIDALKDTRPQVRARAARAIRPRKGDVPPEAFQPLLGLLNDDNPEVKAAALQTLDYYTLQAPQILAVMPGVMKDESPLTRRAALQYLRHHGVAAPHLALAALELAFKDPQPATRIAAIEALTHLGADAAGGAALLFGVLGDPEHRVRAEAADAIQLLGLANDPDKKMLIDEMFALDTVEQYAQAQEEFFIRTWDDNKVHYYASSLKSLTALPAAVMKADAGAAPPAPDAYNGYLFRMLEGQSATAPGGAKKYVVDGKMSQGHAFAAFPAEYGKSGRNTFIVGDDSTIYKKDLGPDTARLGAEMRELNPDDTWTKLKVKPKDEGPVRFHPQERGVEDMEF